MNLRTLSALLLTALAAHGAGVKISDLGLSTSPSDNTYLEIADLNASGTNKSAKILYTNLATVATVNAARLWTNAASTVRLVTTNANLILRLGADDGAGSGTIEFWNAGTKTWAMTGGVLVPQSNYDVGTSGNPVQTIYLTGGSGVLLGNRSISAGTGTPEGNKIGEVGALFLRTDGGAGTTLYTKTSGSGNTGWSAIASAGSGGGNVFNTGTPATNAIPTYVGTTGTNISPSSANYTGNLLSLGTNSQSFSIKLPMADPTRNAFLTTFTGDNGGDAGVTNSILNLVLNGKANAGGEGNTNASYIGIMMESDYIGRSEFHIDMTHPQDATNTAHSNIRPIHIEKFTNLVDPVIQMKGSFAFGNQAGSNWMTISKDGLVTMDPNSVFSFYRATGIGVGSSGLQVSSSAALQFTNTAGSAKITALRKTSGQDNFDFATDGGTTFFYGPLSTPEPVTYNTAGGLIYSSRKTTTTAGGTFGSLQLSHEFAPTSSTTAGAQGVSVLVNSSNGNRPSSLGGVDVIVKTAGSGGFVSPTAFRSAPINFGGTMTAMTHYSIADVSGGGTVTTQYGYYVPPLAAASTNWAFYSVNVPSYLGGGLAVSNNVGRVMTVGDTTFLDILKGSQTNNVTGALTFAHATNGVNGVDYTHVRWMFNSSGSDQTLTIPSGWKTNVFSPVPPALTNATITKMIVNCVGPTASAAAQTNCYVRFEYYK